MAAPSYTTDLTTIATGDLVVDAGTWDESTDAAWDDAGAMVDDQNLYYNNTECVSAQFTKDGVGTIMYVHTGSFTIPTDGAALIHHLWAAPPALATLALGGIRILAGTTLGDFYGWKASGNDFAPAPKGGWTTYAINPGIGSPDYTVGTITTYDMIGMAVSATAQARGNPNACNAVRYGRCESIFTNGDGTNGYATFDGFALVDNVSTNRWSLIDPVEGGYKYQGLMSIGTTATLVDFRDSNRNITIANTINVTSGFNKIEINNASSNISWEAISISALGTVSKGGFEMIDNATMSLTSCTFTDMDTFIFQSNASLLATTFRRCGQVTHGGAIFDDCDFDGYEGTASTGYLSYNVAADPDGELDDCSFTKGTAATHAIDFGTSTPTSITLRGLTFSGYNASNEQNDSTLRFRHTSGTVTVNLVGCSGTITYKKEAGATITFVADPVTTQITVKDVDTGLDIENARVLVWVTDATNFPYQASVTITGTGTTATVTHTAHGLGTNDNVWIEGAEQENYIGAYQITVTGVDTYTFTTAETVITSPATGTIISTFLFLNKLTDSNGVASDSRVVGSNQPVGGRIRKSTSSPYYQQGKISDTVSSTLGYTATVSLVEN